jgi:hypothetical protein
MKISRMPIHISPQECRGQLHKGGVVKSQIRSGIAIMLTVGVLFIGSRASAELITFDLLSPNSAISTYPAPFANVSVNRTDSTHATVTFQTYTTGGNQYVMGDGSTVALNVNASLFTVGPGL